MDKKRFQIRLRIPFVRKRKSIRELTTDESKLGMEKSGATFGLIMKSLRAPKRMLINRGPYSTSKRLNPEGKRKPVLVVAVVLVVIAIVASSQMARNAYRAVGRRANAAANATSNSVHTAASDVDHWVSNKADHYNRFDNETSDRVAKAVLADPQIDARDLSVETNGNIVILHGHVGSEVENQRAEQIARAVLGLSYAVDDKLEVG